MDVTFDFGGGTGGCVIEAWAHRHWGGTVVTVRWCEDGRWHKQAVRWHNAAWAALATSARLCAAGVAHLLPERVDPVVLAWLRTGDPALAEAAGDAAGDAARETAVWAAWEAARSAAWAARAARAASGARGAARGAWASRAALAAVPAEGAQPGAAQPFAEHLLALALWEQAPAQTLREALDGDRQWRHVPGAPVEAWRRVVLCVRPDLRAELEELGWVAEPPVALSSPPRGCAE